MLGGLQRTISQVILRYAQNYLVNIDTDLNLSLWSGDVVLKAVELRLDVLQSLVGYRGYRIDKAVVAELRIHVPWISLTTSSVRITLKGVECAATLDDSLTRPPEGNGHNAPSSPPESKPQIDIEDTTSNEAEQEDGWTKALIGKIIANARVEISDISLRLTGASCQGFVILEAVTLKPADENWVPSYIEPSGPWRMIHALLEVEHLSIGIVEGKSEIVEGKSEIAEHLLDDYVIRDFDAVLRIRTYQSPGVRWIKSNSLAIPSEPCGPRLLVSFLVDSAVEICLSPDKLRMLISLAPLASSGAAHETVTPLDTLMLPSDIGSSAEVVHINFDAKPAEAMKQRKVSWGNWAWDLLAVPPSDLESAIDIGHLAPTKGAVASCDIRSLTITLSKTHRPPLNVSPSKPRSSFLSSPVSNAAFASVTGRSISVHVSIGENNDVRNVSSFLTFSSFAVINQMTALPLFLIAEEVDVCEVMPFIGTSDEQDVGIDAGVPFRTLAQMHPNQETPRPTFSLLFQRRPHKPDTVALRCSSIGAMVPLKSNADTDFIQNLVPFVTLQKSRRLDSDTDHLLEENQATSAHVNVSVDIRRLSLSLHVDDVGDWKHEELFLPAANTLSFQMFSVLFTNDPTSGKRVSFRKCYTQAHDVSLEYRRWRGSRSIDGLLFSMTDASFQNAGFTVESAEMSVSFRHFHFIVLLSMAVCCAWDSLSLSSNIRLQVAALRPRRSLLPQSVLLSHAVLHFHLGGLVVHASKSCTLRTLSASVNRRNQTRLVVFPHPAASDAAPAVDLRFSGRNATSVKSIPMSVVIDSFFLDVLAFATVYRQVIPGSTGDATGSSPTSPSFVTEVMSAIHHLDVDIAPVTFIIPLSDAYHISRRASLFGYRNCSTLCIQLPSVRITKSDVSSIMLDDISVFTIPNTVGPALWRTIANSRSFILEPVGIRCSVIGLSQINVAIDTPVKVSLDEKQASAIKLATAAILPSARSGDHKHLPRKCDAVVHPAHISDVRSIVSVALTLQTIELHTHETSSFSASRMGRTPIDSVRFDVHGLKVSGSVHCGPGAPVCTRLEADVDDVLIAYWCAHRHHQMMTSDGGSLTMERCDGGDALCSVSIRPISALINIDALLSAFAVLELATVKNGDLLSNANGSAGRHSSAQAPSSICINCQIGTVQAGVIAGPSASICVMFDDIDFTRSVGASFKIRENVSIRRLHCFVSEMTTLPASCSEAISSAVDLQVERTGMRIKCQVPPLSLRVTENLLSLVSQVSSKMPSTPSSSPSSSEPNQPHSTSSSWNFDLELPAIVANIEDALSVSISNTVIKDQTATVGNIEACFRNVQLMRWSPSDSESAVLSCSRNWSYIEVAPLHVMIPIDAVVFAMKLLSPKSTLSARQRPQGKSRAHISLSRSTSQRVLVPDIEFHLINGDSRISLMVKDFFAFRAPTSSESFRSFALHTSTLTATAKVEVLFGSGESLLESIVFRADFRNTVFEPLECSDVYHFHQRSHVALDLGALLTRFYPHQLQTVLRDFVHCIANKPSTSTPAPRAPPRVRRNSSVTAITPRTRSDTAATGLFSQDDLRSLQVVVLTATDNCRRPRPGEVILSPLSIAWRYVAPRAVTTISVHAGNIIAAGGQLTLSVSAFDDTGRVFRSVDEFVADFGRSLCHNMPETVAGADEWRITFADPNYDAEEVAHLLRIDSRSDLFIQTTLSCTIAGVNVALASVNESSVDTDLALVQVGHTGLHYRAANMFGPEFSITSRDVSICVCDYSDLRLVRLVGPFGMTSVGCTVQSHCADRKSPLSAMMYEFRHADRAVSLRFDTPLVVNIDSLIVDTLSHIAEQFSLVNATASIPVREPANTELAGETSRPHQCNRILIRNESGTDLQYRQEGSLLVFPLPFDGIDRSFSWPSLFHQQLRISFLESSFWSTPFTVVPSPDPLLISLRNGPETVELLLCVSESCRVTSIRIMSPVRVRNHLPFSLRLRIGNAETLAAPAVQCPVPRRTKVGAGVSCCLEIQPDVASCSWSWASVDISPDHDVDDDRVYSLCSVCVIESLDSKSKMFVWVCSNDYSSIDIHPAYTLTNLALCEISVAFSTEDHWRTIQPGDSVAAFHFDPQHDSGLRIMIGKHIASTVLSYQRIPYSECVRSQADTGEGSVIVELQRQSTGSVVVSVSPPASILNTTLSPLVMLTGGDRDRHQRSLAVKPLESDSLELPHDSCVPLFWSDASTRRFSLADLSAFVVSPSLHCRRSGEFPIDLCSAVALSVTRLSLTVVWETSRTRGDTFDECSHCRITIQPRYVVHNRCPFPIRFQQGEQMPVKQLENEDHRPLSSWPLSSPPIDVIRRGVDFEKGLGVEDLSKLRISLPTYRVAEDTGDEWGWSQEILLSQGGGRRHHLRVRNRVFGYDQLLSYFIIAHDSVSHLIIFRDEQVPYTIVNATSSRITYRALPDACRDDPLSPQSPTVMPLEVAPGLSSQFCGPRDRSNLSTDPEERIFNSGEWNGMYPCYLHLRTPGSQWVSAENAVPLLPGTTRLVHLVSNLHDPEPHMIDSFDHKRRVSSDEERTLQVDVFERFGTTIAVVAPPGQLERVAFGRKIPCDFLSVSIPTIQFNFRDWNDTVFRVSIDGLGVDVAHDTPQSSLLLFRSMSYLEEGAISPCRNLRLRAESFQVDHLRSHEYPVIAHSVKGDARCALSVVCSWSPFIRFDGSDLSLLASPLHMVLSKPDLRSLSLSLSSMHLNLEDAFVASAMAYGTRFIEDVFRKGADSTTASLDSPDWRGNPEFLALLSKITSPRFFAHILDISPVHISLSFSSSRTYLDTNQTPLHFAPIVLRSVLSSQERLIKELSACYLADTIIRSPMLLGSLDLIGNPTQVVSSISKGIHDLVTLPTRALTQGPRAFAWAAMQGVGSLIQHISEGTLMSVSGFTHSLAGNMDRLSQDQYQLNSTPRRFGGRSFATGVTQLVNGVFLGVTGVVTAPIRGAAQQGSWGFVKGCGIGMAGVVTKPMSGALQLVSHTSRGLASSAGLSYVMPDVRPPLNDDSSGSTLDCISYIRLRIMCNRVGEKYCEHFLCGPVVQGSSQLSNRALIVCTSVGVHVIVNDGTDKPFMSFDHPSVDIIGQSVRISDADNTIDVEISGLHRTRLINRIQCFR